MLSFLSRSLHERGGRRNVNDILIGCGTAFTSLSGHKSDDKKWSDHHAIYNHPLCWHKNMFQSCEKSFATIMRLMRMINASAMPARNLYTYTSILSHLQLNLSPEK